MTRGVSLLFAFLLLSGCRSFGDFVGAIDEDGDGWAANAADLPLRQDLSLEPDCDDQDPAVHPEAADVCDDGGDYDCDYDADCHLWPAALAVGGGESEALLWASDEPNARLGSAIAGIEVDGQSAFAVGAPGAADGAGAVYLLSGGSAAASLVSSAGGTLVGPPGARLGGLLVPDVPLTSGSAYLLVGAIGDGQEAIYAIDQRALPLDARVELGDSELVVGGEQGPVGEVLAWSSVYAAEDDTLTLLAGSPQRDAVQVFECDVLGLEPTCAALAVLAGDANSEFGGGLAVLEGPEPLLAVSAAEVGLIEVFDEDLFAEAPEPVVEIDVGDCARDGIVLQAVDIDSAPCTSSTCELDLLVGLPACDAVYLFAREALAVVARSEDPRATLDDNVASWRGSDGAGFGATVMATHDLDGDGLVDLLVGAPDAGSAAEGELWLYQSRRAGLAADEHSPVQLVGTDQDARLGASVAVVSSVDDDDYADIVVGAPNLSSPNTNVGGLYLVSGHGE